MIAVTGAAEGVGRLLVERLVTAAGSGAVAEVVAIGGHGDDAAEVPPGATRRTADVRDPRLAECLPGVDVLVHTDDDRTLETPATQRRADNLRAAQTVLTAAAARRVPRVVLLTSTMVHGADPENPVPLPEDSEVRTETGAGLVGDWVEIEDLACRARRSHPGLSVTVVRPAPLVGPGLDTVLTRHFAAPRLLTVRGREQSWQFCHVEDLASALEYVAVRGVEGGGAVAVGCEGALPQDEAEEIAGLRRFDVPANLVFGATRRLHSVGLTPATAAELRFLVYPCVVDCAALRESGWRPAYDNAEALRALLEARSGKSAVVGRNVGRKEVTITAASAAGAAAAAIGTAAAVRHLRRRRGR
ncbi:NAD-dependent epimerase/dehydratase family protein [Streptomonospora wellingtoniae]|uniref:NAD-dependent epimerase/dehydratase family protein n=1 Tax=Streptomonospora wellingtoniae TaxID=3075544 RepID=A0ABU2KQF5_9ACTN|nr:NAD-dependent epimerase/dehydratase family protein [Streptomonospora sp. DSM 45055]MDT0301517.1 NAD-dependent epimerase/dehydratase family protein [Streptomonospora sp. DSM 45055]